MDINIQVKVRNGRILRAMRDKSIRTASELARLMGVTPSRVGDLLNMKLLPIREDGHWTIVAMKMAGALNMSPEYLWPEPVKLRSNTAEFDISMEQLRGVMAENLQFDRPALDRLLTCVDLKPREHAVLIRRFFGEETLDAIGQDYGIQKERVRQIESVALRKIRSRLRYERVINQNEYEYDDFVMP